MIKLTRHQLRQLIRETIRKTQGKEEWCLYSKDGERNLGCYKSEKGAEDREDQVNYFKHKGKK
tara:strand:- start:665 stop:853 length:189 start_codon:yes stop_codon:yes gene_type:complete